LERYEGTGHMNEAGKCLDQAFISHDQAAKVLKPSVGSLDNPSLFVASKLSAILVRGLLVVSPCRNNRLDPAFGQSITQRVGVISSIHDQPIRVLAGPTALSRSANR